MQQTINSNIDMSFMNTFWKGGSHYVWFQNRTQNQHRERIVRLLSVPQALKNVFLVQAGKDITNVLMSLMTMLLKKSKIMLMTKNLKALNRYSIIERLDLSIFRL